MFLFLRFIDTHVRLALGASAIITKLKLTGWTNNYIAACGLEVFLLTFWTFLIILRRIFNLIII